MTLPERLGRLRRVDRIGAGGFATVWLYHDDDLDSPVAVKALADNWAQRADVRERFLEEARMLRRADSDHVVRVYDIGEADQTPYFVMSYADRGSLATLTDEGGVPADRAVELISQAGIGVHVLHQRGIIHRDIKPQNLLLRSGDDDAEEVLVADLGVAKAMLHASGLTQVVGTPAYMAPEQAIGLGIDRRADVHALGAVAYHLMTGRIARHGGIADLAAPQRPAPPSSVRPDLAAYDEVLLRSMEPNPDHRWPDVPSFIGALRAARREAADSEYAFLYEPSSRAEADTVYLQRTSIDSPVPPAAVDAPEEPAGRGRRALWVLLACLLLVAAVAGGAWAIVANQGGGTAAAGPPSQPTAPTTTPISIAPDIRYPALNPDLALTVKHRIVSPGGSVWRYAVPATWVPTLLAGNGNVVTSGPGAPINKQVQTRWRPDGEPPVGGYSLRFRALDPTYTPQEMLAQRLALLRLAKYPEFAVLKRTQQAIWFTYVDPAGHQLRFNYWQWVPDPAGNAGLEISVSGRTADRPGLAALLANAAAAAHPVS